MADAESDITALVPHIAGLRLSARQVRRLAGEISDPAAIALLGDHGSQLEQLADALQARVEALKKAAQKPRRR